MLRTAAIAVVLLAIQLGLATQASACKGDKVLFDDDFTAYDSMWGSPDDKFEVKGGKATGMVSPKAAWWRWNNAFVFEDADVCVTVTSTKAGQPATNAGVMFWIKDNDNFFVALIAPNGRFFVARKVSGEWANYPVALTPTDAIKQGPNQANTLRITLKGQSVAIAINDKQVSRFRAQAPDRPSHIGLFAETYDEKPAVAEFSALKVTNVK